MEVGGSGWGAVWVPSFILDHSHPLHRVRRGRLPRIGSLKVSGEVNNGIELGMGGYEINDR